MWGRLSSRSVGCEGVNGFKDERRRMKAPSRTCLDNGTDDADGCRSRWLDILFGPRVDLVQVRVYYGYDKRESGVHIGLQETKNGPLVAAAMTTTETWFLWMYRRRTTNEKTIWALPRKDTMPLHA